MSVYVDNARVWWRGEKWCHLVADSLEELHRFADQIGLRREWFQASASYPHYDLTMWRRQRALVFGALVGERRQIIRCAKKLKVEQTIVMRSAYEQLRLAL